MRYLTLPHMWSLFLLLRNLHVFSTQGNVSFSCFKISNNHRSVIFSNQYRHTICFLIFTSFYASIFISNVCVSFSLICIVEYPMETKELTPVRNPHQRLSCNTFQVNNSFLFSQNRLAQPCHNATAI